MYEEEAKKYTNILITLIFTFHTFYKKLINLKTGSYERERSESFQISKNLKCKFSFSLKYKKKC
jgi:hypothetical protein